MNQALNLNPAPEPSELDLTLRLRGRVELLLPDQRPLEVARADWRLLADPAQQSLELKLEIAADQREVLAPFFALDDRELVYRFAMKPEVVAGLLPAVQANPDGDTLLQADAGAALKLENYALLGPSAWLDVAWL